MGRAREPLSDVAAPVGRLKVNPGVVWRILPALLATTMVAGNLFPQSSGPQAQWPAPNSTGAGVAEVAKPAEQVLRRGWPISSWSDVSLCSVVS